MEAGESDLCGRWGLVKELQVKNMHPSAKNEPPFMIKVFDAEYEEIRIKGFSPKQLNMLKIKIRKMKEEKWLKKESKKS